MVAIVLRDVEDDDLLAFHAHQVDPVAAAMAEFPSRDLEAHLAHWRRILAEEAVRKQTVLADGVVVGNVVSFDMDGDREVGYWIGREHWGRGIASKAVAAFLDIEPARPLYGRVATANAASRRVLEKCGFALDGEVDGKLSLVLR